MDLIGATRDYVKDAGYSELKLPAIKANKTFRELIGKLPTGNVTLITIRYGEPVEVDVSQEEFISFMHILEELGLREAFVSMFQYEHSWGVVSYFPQILSDILSTVMEYTRNDLNNGGEREDAWLTAQIFDLYLSDNASPKAIIRFNRYPACTCKQCFKDDIVRFKYNPIKILSKQIFYRRGHKFLIGEAKKYQRQFTWRK